MFRLLRTHYSIYLNKEAVTDPAQEGLYSKLQGEIVLVDDVVYSIPGDIENEQHLLRVLL